MAYQFTHARAHWVKPHIFAWNIQPDERFNFMLHYAPYGGMEVTSTGVQGGESLPLYLNIGGIPGDVTSKFPHLTYYTALYLENTSFIQELLRGQLLVSAQDMDGRFIDATAVQIPGILDECFTYRGDLGITFDGDVPALRVWAPTARNIHLHLYPDSGTVGQVGTRGLSPLPENNHPPDNTVFPMNYDSSTGVWSITGQPDWKYQFYLFEVDVFYPMTGRMEKNFVTDPYSVSLSTNSTRSQIVDLNAPELMPPGWHDLQKPDHDDLVVYELHVRDFSITDMTVSEVNRGKFRAFTEFESNGMRHLRALADSGLTHLHLLPVADFATIEEDARKQLSVDFEELSAYLPDSDWQQGLVHEVRHRDGFNWGYDPFHYSVPEGSYSTDPDGALRILEFREMVMALNRIGLRVVMDVVYNHTFSSGLYREAVLDRVVPGYYHRLNADGYVENSTCCSNTATEHNMMEKLMLDSIYMWATAYKVDGFRFDLMGHHMRDNIIHVRQMLDSLPDGEKIYVYGEGWDFGELVGGRRGTNATQFNMAGTGIGTFNDRLRDAVRGGGHFGHVREQGFINGLYYESNKHTHGSKKDQRLRILHDGDVIRVGMAGNLRDFRFINAAGDSITGWELLQDGAPVGYCINPRENVVYVAAHDNETLFDIIQYKAPAKASMDDRVRMNNLGVSIVLMSQGIPFLHAGDDTLRSKSLDRDSYKSGDWFNRLDWTYETNNWGVGLPIFDKNQHNWHIQRELLGNPALMPTRDHILKAVMHCREMLQIRRSSPLFSLKTAEEVKELVKFYNVGLDQIPGVIVMGLADELVVIINAASKRIAITDDHLGEFSWRLHPIQVHSYDTVVRRSKYVEGTFTVPGRTTAVFVRAGGI